MGSYLLASLGVVILGIDKGGFAGGIGIIAVPLFVLAFGDPKEAVAIMLPILCVCDIFALYHYRHAFDKKNVARMLPGAVIGIAAGGYLLNKVSGDQLKFWIGVIAILFVIYQLGKTWIFKELEAYNPKTWHGWFFGSLVGLTSTLAHAGGPPATIFLLPQNLGRQLYVGTNVILFAFVNYVKLIPYTYLGLITFNRVWASIGLMILIPFGTWLGVWMNHRINETMFRGIIYTFLFLIGLKYIGFDPISRLFGV